MTFIQEAGYMAWPILACAVIALTLAGRSWMRLGREEANLLQTAAGIDGVLFWGSFGAVIGLLGTLIGISIAAQSIEMAGSVSTPLVWGGLRVALHPLLMGLVLLSVSLLTWFVLRGRLVGQTIGD